MYHGITYEDVHYKIIGSLFHRQHTETVRLIILGCSLNRTRQSGDLVLICKIVSNVQRILYCLRSLNFSTDSYGSFHNFLQTTIRFVYLIHMIRQIIKEKRTNKFLI